MEIPVRSCGTNTTDLNTQDLIRSMQTALFNRTGKYAHLVINRLSRSRLDANRDSTEATCGNSAAGVAWREWNELLAVARQATLDRDGKGWYIDMHGHGHDIQRLELGYLLSDATLSRSDGQLDATGAFEYGSSIRTLSEYRLFVLRALARPDEPRKPVRRRRISVDPQLHGPIAPRRSVPQWRVQHAALRVPGREQRLRSANRSELHGRARRRDQSGAVR